MFVTRGRALVAAAVAAAVTGTVLPFVDPPIYVGGGGNPVVTVIHGGGTNTAHLWMSAAGTTTCVRDASAVIYTTALTDNAVCSVASNQRAYTQANLGDTIYVEGAVNVTAAAWIFPKTITKTVTAGTCNYNYGGSPDLSQCETFTPAPDGSSLQFTVTVSGAAHTGQVVSCVSGLSIQQATWNQTTYVESATGNVLSAYALSTGSSDNFCGTTLAPHDEYFASDTFNAQVNVSGGVSNVWVVNSLAAGARGLPWQYASTGNGGLFPAVNHSGVVNTIFNGFNFTVVGAHHMECVHVDTSENTETWAGNQFRACPIESLFFETESGSQHDNLIENNYFDTGSSGGPFKLDCRQPGCVESNNIIRFNSFSGAMSFNCEAATGVCNIDNNVFYGNVKMGCIAISTSGATIVGTGLVDQGYNVLTGAKVNSCTASTSAYSATVNYVSAGSPAYNLDLSGSQQANGFGTGGFVPNSVTWPLSGTNIHGTARTGATTNAGAD